MPGNVSIHGSRCDLTDGLSVVHADDLAAAPRFVEGTPFETAETRLHDTCHDADQTHKLL
ncbi:MAG: hypothetical protein NVSMB42_16520 [Herpetosiphon sp.]